MTSKSTFLPAPQYGKKESILSPAPAPLATPRRGGERNVSHVSSPAPSLLKGARSPEDARERPDFAALGTEGRRPFEDLHPERHKEEEFKSPTYPAKFKVGEPVKIHRGRGEYYQGKVKIVNNQANPPMYLVEVVKSTFPNEETEEEIYTEKELTTVTTATPRPTAIHAPVAVSSAPVFSSGGGGGGGGGGVGGGGGGGKGRNKMKKRKRRIFRRRKSRRRSSRKKRGGRRSSGSGGGGGISSYSASPPLAVAHHPAPPIAAATAHAAAPPPGLIRAGARDLEEIPATTHKSPGLARGPSAAPRIEETPATTFELPEPSENKYYTSTAQGGISMGTLLKISETDDSKTLVTLKSLTNKESKQIQVYNNFLKPVTKRIRTGILVKDYEYDNSTTFKAGTKIDVIGELVVKEVYSQTHKSYEAVTLTTPPYWIFVPSDAVLLPPEEGRKDAKFGRVRKSANEFVREYCRRKNCSEAYAMKKYKKALSMFV